jgi:hypothetical protein
VAGKGVDEPEVGAEGGAEGQQDWPAGWREEQFDDPTRQLVAAQIPLEQKKGGEIKYR